MASDESAKPHPAHKDRNPFDISRRSEEDVAAEIAARLSAWKQARNRGVGPVPIAPSRLPQAAHTMVTPGGHRPAGQHPVLPQRMPQFGEFAEERRVPETRTAEPRAPEPRPPVVAGPSALNRAIPAAPSLGQNPGQDLGRPARAFPFRAGIQRPPKPDPAPIPTETVTTKPAPVVPAEIEPRAEIETPDVEPRPLIHAPAIDTWEDEEAAIAAAAIPRLDIPERITVPMAGRHAARGGTNWAMSLGVILLFLGVTLPAALWQRAQPTSEATAIASAPIPQPAPTAAAPAATPAADAPAPVSSPFSTIAEQKMRQAFAPYESLRTFDQAREIAAVPINVPTAAGPAPSTAEPSTAAMSTGAASAGDVASTAPTGAFPVARPFIPSASATHVLVPPSGAVAVNKPAARLKPVASAVAPAPKATKPAAQKPPPAKPSKPRTVEQMVDDLFSTLSNGQPPNPALQPDSPGTRR